MDYKIWNYQPQTHLSFSGLFLTHSCHSNQKPVDEQEGLRVGDWCQAAVMQTGSGSSRRDPRRGQEALTQGRARVPPSVWVMGTGHW